MVVHLFTAVVQQIHNKSNKWSSSFINRTAGSDSQLQSTALPTTSTSTRNDGPMPNVMAALTNIGGALCSTPQSLADAHCYSAVQ